ncbi:hypothetical protein EVA_04231 [gut metagenome]|uniref:Uncharacterized protein n=1 Tax=gut metagenome TaxID=749906 RepID=J9GK39_9ZZZZ
MSGKICIVSCPIHILICGIPPRLLFDGMMSQGVVLSRHNVCSAN